MRARWVDGALRRAEPFTAGLTLLVGVAATLRLGQGHGVREAHPHLPE